MRKVLLPIEKAGYMQQDSTGKVPPELSLRDDCIPAEITDFGQTTSNKTRASLGRHMAPAERAKLAINPMNEPTYEPRYERMKTHLKWLEAQRGKVRGPWLAGACMVVLAVFSAGTIKAQ